MNGRKLVAVGLASAAVCAPTAKAVGEGIPVINADANITQIARTCLYALESTESPDMTESFCQGLVEYVGHDEPAPNAVHEARQLVNEAESKQDNDISKYGLRALSLPLLALGGLGFFYASRRQNGSTTPRLT